MANECLVLNSAWIPIETISWQDAFTKIFNGRAYAVDYYEETVKTPSDEYFKPAVIVCTEYSKVPIRPAIYSKRMVCLRDGYICQYCEKKLSNSTATLDHVVPRSKGGKSTFRNTVCACLPCNSQKADKTLKESGMSLIKTPRAPTINPIRAKFERTKLQKEWEIYLKQYIG